jgi:hypothetical protein
MVSHFGKLAGLLMASMLVASHPAVARADATPVRVGDRIVSLRDGSIYRGTLVELVVGDHVTIKLATGEVKRFEWSAVKETNEALAEPPAPPAAGSDGGPRAVTADGTPIASLPPEDQAVSIEVSADRPGAKLYRLPKPDAAGRNLDSDTWELVCAAPCKTKVDRRFPYAVAGSNVVSSDPFVIPARVSSVHVDASVASRSTKITGWVMFGIAAPFAVGGLVLATTAKGQTDTIVEGVALGLTGLGFSVLGLVLASKGTSLDFNAAGAVKTGRIELAPGLALGSRGLEF